jgi:hypothetical protein
MVAHLSMGNSLEATIEALSVEFKVSKPALYADYERMETWVHDIQADQVLCSKLKQRLEFLNRTALDMLLDLNSSGDGKKRQLSVKEQFVKIGAINTVLRVTQEQIKLGQELGLIERKPEVIEINQTGGQEIDLSKLSEEERKSILYAEELLSRTEKDAGTG